MPTYQNAYELVSQVRVALNEGGPAYVQGQDTSGAFQNAFILKAINDAILEIYSLLAQRIPEEFLVVETVATAGGEIALPVNFGRLLEIRNPDGTRGAGIGVPERARRPEWGSKLRYYFKGNRIVIDSNQPDSLYTLAYLRRPREIHHGVIDGASITSPYTITLDEAAKKVASYYDGMLIEIVSEDAVETIQSYTAARVATVASAHSVGSWYGLVPDIPEWAHNLIAPRAVIRCKTHPASPEKPSPAEIRDYQEMLRQTISTFAAPKTPTNWETIFVSHDDGAWEAFS
ncbi:MAG: hypothetical protein WHT06_15875 [Desulfobacterales bacterium]